MNILQLIKDIIKIDFTSTIVELDSGTGSTSPFELTARDFLRFAKSDFKLNDRKGNINALTNAKRAIDCQTDTALTLFGIDYDQIPKNSNKIIELTHLKKIDLPYKLKLIQALDFAPGGLISKTRTLRNKLEHYYKVPKKEEIRDAIELAELFVLSIESHLKIIEDTFTITDEKNFGVSNRFYNCIRIYFRDVKKNIDLDFYKEDEKIETLTFNQNDEIYYALIKMINNIHEQIELEDTMKIFLKMINHPIPENKVQLDLR